MLRKPSAPSLPDVRSLAPGEAKRLCRFCLRSHSAKRTMHHLNENNTDSIGLVNWPDSKMGLLYAQITGGEQLIATTEPPDLISDAWCSECAEQLEQAAKSIAEFRAANAFWADYLRVRCASPSLPLVDVKVEMMNVDEFKVEKLDADEPRPNTAQSIRHYDEADWAESDDSAAEAVAEEKPIVARRRGRPPKASTVRSAGVAAAAPKPAAAAVKAEKPATPAAVPPSLALQVCHICGNQYKGKMDRHMKAAHSTLVCDLCGSTFSHKVTLRRHFRDDHGFERHSCDVCGATNMTRSMWKRHMEMHRPAEERPFACEQCGKDYRTLRVLKQHLARAHDHVQAACEECGKTFINAIRLRDHMIRHKPRTIRCPLAGCPRMFFQVKEMKEHHRTVHVKDRKYVCAVCGKAFLVNAQLKKHHSLGRCPGPPGADGPAKARGRGPGRQQQPHLLQQQQQHQQLMHQQQQQQHQLLLMQQQPAPVAEEQQRLEHHQMAAAIAVASAKHAAETQMLLLHQQHQQHQQHQHQQQQHSALFGGSVNNTTATTTTTTTHSPWSTMSQVVTTAVLAGDGHDTGGDVDDGRSSEPTEHAAGALPMNAYMR